MADINTNSGALYDCHCKGHSNWYLTCPNIPENNEAISKAVENYIIDEEKAPKHKR